MSAVAQRRTVHRWGYGFSALVNLVLAWAVNVWPGWEAVAFLDDATTEVLPLVNLSLLILVASLIAALTLVFFEAPPWLVGLAGASAALAAEEMIRKP